MSAISSAASGLQAAGARLDAAARELASGADPSGPLVALATAREATTANAATLRVAESLTRALLDIRV